MRLDTLKYFYEKASGHNPSFYYRGPFLEKFTNTILDMSNVSAQVIGSDGIGKKVSFMLVECFQNILKHAEKKETEETLSDEGMFSFKNLPGAFIINSINHIQNSEQEKLEALVRHVNSMDEKDLKQFYLDSLKNNTISEKGGAGLGLIEMARRSGQKILYEIENLNSRHSLFHQQITIRRSVEACSDYSTLVNESKEFYHKMTEQDLVLFYKGDFSQKSILPLLELAEHNVYDRNAGQRRTMKAAHVTVEVLQNISKHARAIDAVSPKFGIFMLGKMGGSLCILAGNIVPVSEKIFLEDKLDYLISLDNEGLRELHRSTLKATLRFESKSNSGLGLIEVAQASSQTLQYRFYPYGKDQYLFALQVII